MDLIGEVYSNMKFEDAVKQAISNYFSDMAEKDPLAPKPMENYEKARGKKIKYNKDFFKRMEGEYVKPSKNTKEVETNDS